MAWALWGDIKKRQRRSVLVNPVSRRTPLQDICENIVTEIGWLQDLGQWILQGIETLSFRSPNAFL